MWRAEGGGEEEWGKRNEGVKPGRLGVAQAVERATRAGSPLLLTRTLFFFSTASPPQQKHPRLPLPAPTLPRSPAPRMTLFIPGLIDVDALKSQSTGAFGDGEARAPLCMRLCALPPSGAGPGRAGVVRHRR